MVDAIITFLKGYFGDAVWANILIAFRFVFYSSFVWLPIALFVGLIKMWITYIRLHFIRKQGSVLLEIKIPKEMNKSPAAMEIFISHFHQSGTPNYIEAYWEGKSLPWFSLELVSIDGEVKFYVWAPAKARNGIEAQLYAQFPNIEVYDAEDYAAKVPYNPNVYKYFGMHWKLAKPDAYPIKTYVDYGLDKDPKEEFKIDPITSVLEYLGSMKAGEQAWIQILIKPHRKEGLKDARLFNRPDWKKAAKDEIRKIASEGLLGDSDVEKGTTLKLTRGQQDTIAAIERSIGKFPFETMMRGMYIAKKEVFNPVNIGGMIGNVKQYSSNELNGFKPGFRSNDIDYPWQDFRGLRVARWTRQIFEAYKRRSIFYPPFKNFKDKPYILTTEEIATMWHFPGAVAGTPTLIRVPSKKSEAPGNLPI